MSRSYDNLIEFGNCICGAICCAPSPSSLLALTSHFTSALKLFIDLQSEGVETCEDGLCYPINYYFEVVSLCSFVGNGVSAPK